MAIKAKSGGATGFLARLKRAEAGNVLPMMAMAIIPIAGMIGSGLDMSRAYLVKAKLQTACDSTPLPPAASWAALLSAARLLQRAGSFSLSIIPLD
jgi:hypothetical protein